MNKVRRFVRVVNAAVFPSIGKALVGTVEVVKTIFGTILLLCVAVAVGVVHLFDRSRQTAEEMNEEGAHNYMPHDQR